MAQETEVEMLRRVVREQNAAMARLLQAAADADAVCESVKGVLLDGMCGNHAAMKDPARDSTALRRAHNHMADAYVLLNGGTD